MPNRLIHEHSPYLLQHAHNPVDWYPWSDEAFAKARTENKPIFLSIGYSTCHWCHVMERESFENEEIAAVLNRHFVCIKLDREERPDIDHIYMTAVQSTTGSGGWPMSVWLTPDRQPFYCGTYFPPESRYGRPGFRQLLERIHDAWETNHAGVTQQARQITDLLHQHAGAGDGGGMLSATALAAGLQQFQASFDAEHGGFGGAPKFPRPVALNFVMRAGGQDMGLLTLRKMGEGGMFDQLGGGFHRYSVDERWLVSHFEKMLYDQAQLVVSYCEAFQITRDPFFVEIARRTCDYVLREMTSPAGGFYSAEDADSEGVEGKFYVWQRAEITDAAIADYYGVTEPGNWEHGLNVLHVVGRPAPANLADIRQQLFTIRAGRIRPHRDDKILAAWNGLMISALCRMAQVSGEKLYAAAAERAASAYVAGELKRTPTVPALLDDYAAVATAFVDLYETTLAARYLQRAQELSDIMLRLFFDETHGGFFMTDGRDASVLVRAKEEYDGAEPSGNSVATLLLLRLAHMTGRAEYRTAAEKTLHAFAGRMERAPHAVPQLLCALDFYLHPPRQIVFVGDPAEFLPVIHEGFQPRQVLLMSREEATPRPLVNGRPTVYVCEDFVCRQPVTTAAELRQLLG